MGVEWPSGSVEGKRTKLTSNLLSASTTRFIRTNACWARHTHNKLAILYSFGSTSDSGGFCCIPTCTTKSGFNLHHGHGTRFIYSLAPSVLTKLDNSSHPRLAPQSYFRRENTVPRANSICRYYSPWRYRISKLARQGWVTIPVPCSSPKLHPSSRKI